MRTLLLPLAGLLAQDLETRAARLHREAIVVDTHVDTLQRVLLDDADLGRRLPDGHGDLVRFVEGGLDVPFLSLWVDPIFEGTAAVKRTLRLIDAFDRVVAAYPERIGLARTAGEAEDLARAGKIAAVLEIEGGHAIDDDLGVLRAFHRLGVRAMTLAHTNTNNWCDSSADAPRHGGLSEFGRRVVAEMNRIGMLVDVSHVSDEAFFDALEASAKPVIASHSSCRAICPHPRNLTDSQLRALARNGGVVGITFVATFLDEDFRKGAASGPGPGDGMEELRRRFGADLDAIARASYSRFRGRAPAVPLPPLDRLLDHLDHAVRVAGVDHVGLGSDFDGTAWLPAGLEDAARLPKITEGLLRRGYSEADARKILGENLLRVMRAALRD